QMAQVRSQPSFFLLSTHLCHPRESKGASEGALGAKDTAHRHRPPWRSKAASFSQGGGSRRVKRHVAWRVKRHVAWRVKRHVAYATMARCRRTCGSTARALGTGGRERAGAACRAFGCVAALVSGHAPLNL